MPINESAEKPNPAPGPTGAEHVRTIRQAYEDGKAGSQAPRLDPPGGAPLEPLKKSPSQT